VSRYLILICAVVLGASACSRPPIEDDDPKQNSKPDAGQSDGTDGTDAVDLAEGCGAHDFGVGQKLETDERVELVLSGMTLADKIDQMAGVEPTAAELFATPDNEHANIRGFKFRDGPRGVRLEEGSATCFPVPVARGATWDLDLEKRIGRAMAVEVKGLGHNVLLAPTINTLRHPGWGRAQETYGEDPWFLGMMGIAMTSGIQELVPACVKHLAGNNIEDTRMTNNAVMDEQTLRENYLRQFKMVVQRADAACVMAAYNKVNGAYCCENNHLLRTVLKGEWKFDGFVVSDWFAAQSTVESAIAGLDVEMPWRNFFAKLELAVSGEQVDTDVIDDATRRILRTKFEYGFALLDEPVKLDPSVVESKAHIALAKEAAEKSIVLLKNKGDLLPLNRKDKQTIAVVGLYADEARLGDNGSSKVKPSYAVSPFQGIKKGAGDNITVVTSTGADALEGADLAIVVGALTHKHEGEALLGGGDRDELMLPKAQEELILEATKKAKRTIVLLEAGGPITMESWEDKVDAIVMAWYPGMEGGTAIASLIFGDINFSGRLIQTWPKQDKDEPLFGNKQDETEFNFYHGYRHFDHNKIEPLYPFGYGLSYTSFEVSNLVVPCSTVSAAGKLDVTVDVKNTGKVAGVEIVQAYVGYPDSTARRPDKELKGFARVELKPDESKAVTISIRVEDLAYYDEKSSAWIVENLKHRLMVGHNANNLPLTGEFTITSQGK